MRGRWLGFLVAVLTGAASAWAYPRLPATVATHWNLAGQPDGFSPRIVAVVFLPALILALTAVLQALPARSDALHDRGAFADTYWTIVNNALILLGVLHIAVLANGAGAPVDPFVVVPAGFGMLLLVIGSYLRRAPFGAAIAVRTPWTVANEAVWRATHRTAGWLCTLGGVAVIATGLFRRVASVIVLLVVGALLAVIPVVQSASLASRTRADAND